MDRYSQRTTIFTASLLLPPMYAACAAINFDSIKRCVSYRIRYAPDTVLHQYHLNGGGFAVIELFIFIVFLAMIKRAFVYRDECPRYACRVFWVGHKFLPHDITVTMIVLQTTG